METKLPPTLVGLGALFATLFTGLCFVGYPTWLFAASVVTAVAFLMEILRHESHVLPYSTQH